MATVAELWEQDQPASTATAPTAAPVARAQPNLQSVSTAANAPSTVAELWDSVPVQPQEKTASEGGIANAARRFLGRRIGEIQELIAPSTGSRLDVVVPQLAAAADIPASLPGMVASESAYATRRGLGDKPEQAEAISRQVAGAAEQPVGRLLGVAGTQEYKGGTLPELMSFVSENIAKGADWIAEKTGMSKLDAQHAINTAMLMAPELARTGLKPYETVPAAGEAAPGWRAAPEGATPTTAPTANAAAVSPETAAYSQRRMEPVMQMIGGEEVPAQAPTPQGAANLSVGAAQVQQKPYTLTGEETGKHGGAFPQVKLSKIAESIPVAEQQQVANIIDDVMQGKAGIRTGVLKGDKNALANEYEIANQIDKTGELTPAAQVMRNQIAAEQNAISDYAQQRIEAAGADSRLQNDYARGQRLNDAIYGENGLYGEINRQKEAIYDQAKQVVGDNPVETPNVNSLLSSRQFKGQIRAAKQSDFTSGLQDLLDLHKEEGFAGTMPNSIASLEELRKAANALRTPDNARFVGQVINAIDEDIASAGGPGLYQRAREIHRAEKVLFEPKGVQKIFGKVSENGIKEGTPTERIIANLNSLPFDEWAHIHDTFESLARGEMPGKLQGLTVTPELQAYAQSALGEMKGAIARDIYEAGAGKKGEWNAQSANTAMNQYADKLQYAFSPEELKAFHHLNYAGYKMPPLGYEGAARQRRRVEAVDKTAQAAKLAATAAENLAAAKGIPTFGKLSSMAEKFKLGRSEEAAQEYARQLQQEMQANKNALGDIASMRPKK